MLNIELKMIKNIGKIPNTFRSTYAVKRYAATQTKVIEDERLSGSAYNDREWENALPYEKIPGPSKLSFFRSFMPGGKNNKKSFFEIVQNLRKEYGDILIFPGILKNPELVMTFNPKDFEKCYRTEGYWPERMTLEAPRYFRKVKMADFYKESAGLVIENDKAWADTRSILNPVLMQPRTVNRYIRPLDEVTNDLIERIKSDRNAQTLEVPTDFNRTIQSWALECTGVLGLDTRFNLINGKNKDPNVDRLVENVDAFFKLMFETEIKPNLSKYISTPKYRKFMKVMEELQEITVAYVEQALKRIENDPESSSKEKGVLERVAAVNKHVAIVMVSDMLMVGIDTTMSGLTSCLFHIAKNPQKQEILRQELRQIMPTKDSPLTKENMNSLPYLRACIKEAFRLSPVVAGNGRVTKQDLVLSGYQIPKGKSILMSTQILQREEKHYPKPDSFIPERWLKAAPEGCPSAKTANPFIFLPFGFGPRMCIGKRFAQMELEVGIAKIIRNFKLEYNHQDITFEQHAINMPTGSFAFKFTDLEN